MSLILGLAIAGGVMGLVKGASNKTRRDAEYADKMQELERTQEANGLSLKHAKSSLNLGVNQANDATERANDELALLSQETLANRDMAIGQTGKMGSMQSNVDALQMATLQVQAKEAAGQASQRAATSGFRNSGSNEALVDNTKRRGDEAVAETKMRAKLSNYQTFASAVNTYTDANQRAEAYARKIENNDADLAADLARMNMQYNQTKEKLDLEGGFLAKDIDYMNDEGKKAKGWANALGFIADVGTGAMQGAALA